MKIITVHCVSKPERRSDLIALGTSMVKPSRAEEGCIHYSFYHDLNEENRFFFYEEWKDQASIDLHNATKHFLEFQPKFKEMIVSDAVVTVHNAG
ncbi:MAG: putative quinol monooxygenase [Bacteroidota bacterium]